MSGPGPISAEPSPADSSSGHAVRDTHRSGQIQAITTVAEPHGWKRRSNRTTRPSAPAECALRQAQNDQTNKAPSGHAVYQVKRQNKQKHPAATPSGTPTAVGRYRRSRRSPSLTDGKWRSNRSTRPSAPAEYRLRQAQKDKTKTAPSGHAVRDTHCSGLAQTTTIVAESHGLKRRANCNTSPYRPWIHI